MSTLAEITEAGEFGVITSALPTPLPADILQSQLCYDLSSSWSTCAPLHASSCQVIVKKKLEPWQRVPSAMYNTMVHGLQSR